MWEMCDGFVTPFVRLSEKTWKICMENGIQINGAKTNFARSWNNQ